MKKIKEFINNHKVISWVIGVFFGILLIDSIINNDFESLGNILYSSGMLCIYLFIFYLLVSKKSYLCPKCGGKIQKKDSSCKHCGEVFTTDSNENVSDSKPASKPVSKRVVLKSKVFYSIGEAIASIPLGLGFLYLIMSPIVFATNGESFTLGNTLFVCYTAPHLLPIAITCTVIGVIFILIGYSYKKKEQ